MGILYLVSTPIGNIEDISLRAQRILSEVDLIACEDTRKTGWLLEKLALPKTPSLVSYFEENELQRIPEIIQWLKEDKNVALVSNAGTPTLSDPGFKLVRECLDQEIKVIPIPGSSAVLAALVASGLPTDKFFFLGYLPKKSGKAKNLLTKIKTLHEEIPCTVIFYESPFRLLKTLKLMQEVYSDIEVVVSRELTKIFEETKREKISLMLTHFQKKTPKGEFTVLFNLPKE